MPLSPSLLPHELLGLPWQFLVLGLALCLIFSALGFKRVEYFVSLGYAASVTAQAIAFPFLYRETIRGLALLQSGMLLAYGLRLGIFLALRDRVPSFQKQRVGNTDRSIKVGGTIKVAIWVGVSVFYVLLFLPALLTMSAQAGGMALASAPRAFCSCRPALASRLAPIGRNPSSRSEIRPASAIWDFTG